MKYFVILCITLFYLTGCNNNKRTPENPTFDPEVTVYEDDIIYDDIYEDDDIPAVDSLGYYGIYEGTAPVGGRTLKTTMTLYDNDRYVIHSVDLGDNTRTEEEHGTYMIFGDLLTLVPDNNGTEKYYRNNDDHVFPLDENQQEIPTQHSQNFRLNRK